MTERLLRVGAIAISHRHANVVGPVRLSCERDALRIDLLRVGRFAAGFVFVGLADVASYRVPYRAVRALVSDGQLLHLAIDPTVASPYNRFALAHFSHDPDAALLRAFRVRTWAALGSYLGPVPLAAAALWRLPREPVGGPVGSAAVALRGRVPVKASAEGGAIRPGDLLTSANTPGHAMRYVPGSSPVRGVVLGKALTALAEGTGEVLVLVGSF
ncbi:MAG: hypothetical protein HY812_00185 [Planctomycetes bacterium]|nr:hypothetical protein [Planctomycetota bacterium]